MGFFQVETSQNLFNFISRTILQRQYTKTMIALRVIAKKSGKTKKMGKKCTKMNLEARKVYLIEFYRIDVFRRVVEQHVGYNIVQEGE